MEPKDRSPLSTLLSKTLVAFTIEFDNEAEHRLPHRTTDHGASTGSHNAPWLISMARWFNCLRFVDENGISVRALEQKARTPTNLDGMRRWGYVTLAPDPADRRPKPPPSSWLIRTTPGGRLARQVCGSLFAEIDNRWNDRFGPSSLARLKDALLVVAAKLDPGLPDCMPILGYGLRNADRLTKLPAIESGPDSSISAASIPILLAKILLTFALDFEHEAEVSLAIYANLLRILREEPVRVRDLPAMSGMSKESLAMATGFLVKKGLVRVESAGNAGRRVRLTALGIVARDHHQRLLAEIEKRWLARFGTETMTHLRQALEALIGDDTPEGSPLFKGLQPYPDGWRAAYPVPSTLPHFPMVLHRGGYPEGS
jgi:DNA-binding MarR family transcriptional regulator